MKIDLKLANKTPHVLLVEDNLIVSRITETFIKKTGCTFTTVTEGELALDLIKSVDFDLIITDLGLPGISGLEMTESIRKREQSLNKKPTPIVGLTAQPLAEIERECLLIGMDRLIIKPIYFDTMQELVIQFILQDGIDQMQNKEKSTSNLLNSDEQLFVLQRYPLLNTEVGIKNLGNEKTLRDLLQLMIVDAIPEDEAAIRQAYAEKNWDQIVNIAHKMKSGTLYCGTVRMQYACQYLEHYCKAGHQALLEQLYQQLMQVVGETKTYIKNWLTERQES